MPPGACSRCNSSSTRTSSGCARAARAIPRRAEIQNLYLDATLLGVWVAMAGFPTWITFGALFSISLNVSVMRGWQGGAGAIVGFCIGALLWVAPMGFIHAPQTSDLITALCFFGSLAYSIGVGVVSFGQSQRLQAAREALRESEQQLPVHHRARGRPGGDGGPRRPLALCQPFVRRAFSATRTG